MAKGIVQDIPHSALRCLDCSDHEEAGRTAAETILGLHAELGHVREMHAVTMERKSVVFQDWLADRTMIWKLRCQIRELGSEPTC